MVEKFAWQLMWFIHYTKHDELICSIKNIQLKGGPVFLCARHSFFFKAVAELILLIFLKLPCFDFFENQKCAYNRTSLNGNAKALGLT